MLKNVEHTSIVIGDGFEGDGKGFVVIGALEIDKLCAILFIHKLPHVSVDFGNRTDLLQAESCINIIDLHEIVLFSIYLDIIYRIILILSKNKGSVNMFS